MARVVHFELLAKQPERIVRFYEEALGWKSSTWGGGEQAYWLVSTGPENQRGIHGAVMDRHFDQAVINTVEVASLEETTRKIEQAGGKRVQGPNEIPGIGLHAYFTDPEGTMFGVLQPLQRG